jgi:NAD(P)-dependent dehydrogenase (short-subunit alcohol dehydrogenase family)
MEEYRRVMDVNFFAVVNLNQHLLPYLKEPTSDGVLKRIIILSSVCGIVTLPANSPYGASKYALEAYAHSLRIEQSFWNIAVSVINPSTMRTPIAMNYCQILKRSYEAAVARDASNGNSLARWRREWTPEWLEKTVETTEKALKDLAEEPGIVVKDLLHAMQSAAPRSRYLSGSAAKTLFWLLWTLPERWTYGFKKSLLSPPPKVLKDDKLPTP